MFISCILLLVDISGTCNLNESHDFGTTQVSACLVTCTTMSMGQKSENVTASSTSQEHLTLPNDDESASISKSRSSEASNVGTKTVDFQSARGSFYSVAAKDASLIERIAHKAPRTARVLEPHEVFIELEELRYDSMESLEWKETARWIKFEEDVELDVGRWGRPHVSALAFHSLVDLRKGLEQGLLIKTFIIIIIVICNYM